MPERVSFSDLATAAYCPRQLYYARRDDDRGPPGDGPLAAARDLAGRYRALLADPQRFAGRLAVPPEAAGRRLETAREGLDCWDALVDPPERDAFLVGKDARGYADKVLPGDPPVPSFVSPGEPPERGVYGPQRVRATAMAKALSWRAGQRVERALVEYPRYGAVRTVAVTVRGTAAYRRALRAVRSLDGPPPRVDDDARCRACEYAGECGVRTRSLASLL